MQKVKFFDVLVWHKANPGKPYYLSDSELRFFNMALVNTLRGLKPPITYPPAYFQVDKKEEDFMVPNVTPAVSFNEALKMVKEGFPSSLNKDMMAEGLVLKRDEPFTCRYNTFGREFTREEYRGILKLRTSYFREDVLDTKKGEISEKTTKILG